MDSHCPIPASGRIDLHCHLLPGIDDGCQTLDQSLRCIRQWMKAGFAGSVCTPHVGATWYRANTADRIAQHLELLRAEIAARDWEYQLWDGGEVRLSADVIEWFAYVGLPTLGTSRCVLLDWWGNQWPAFCDEACEFLLENDFQPILAHPERMGLNDRKLDAVLDRLQAAGVWLQGNLNSVGGGEGPQAQERALSWLRDGRYHVLATDTHGPDSVAGRIAGLELLAEELDDSQIHLLLEERPRDILRNGCVRAT